MHINGFEGQYFTRQKQTGNIFFFQETYDRQWYCTILIFFLRTCTWHTDFSSRMMHGCGLVNMTGSLRSSHCRMCLHYRLRGSLANLLTSSPARYSTEEQFAVIDTVTTLSPLLSPRPLPPSSPPRLSPNPISGF